MSEETNTEQPIDGLEGIDLDNLSEDSTDVSESTLSELLGTDEQPETDSNKLDHDKSVLGEEKDELDELLADDKDEDADSDEQPETDSEDAESYEVNGEKVTKDELIKGYQRQQDYTKKTQEAATIRKDAENFLTQAQEKATAIETEANEFKQQNQTALSEYEQMVYATQIIEQDDPDFFQELKEKIGAASAYYRNPMVDKLSQELTELKGRLGTQEDTQTIGKFYTEYGAASANILPKLQELGIEVDQSKVQDMWAKDMSVKQAINALYGEQIQKVRESKLIKDRARKSVDKRKKTPMGGKTNTPPATKFRSNDYNAITNAYLGR